MPDLRFEGAGLRARELEAGDVPRLQALFEAHPQYFETVNGRPPRPDEAQAEFDERPPAHLSFARRWFLGLFDADDRLHGVVVLLSDFTAPAVWHLALFLLATPLHGTGAAQAVHAAMLRWMSAQGARWLRLGVVAGNVRAEHFWHGLGYVEMRQRRGVDTGGLINDVRVLARPLAADARDGSWREAYLGLVPRDRPDSTLP